MGRIFATLLAVLFAGTAHAEPIDLRLSSTGYTYFNRPKADMAVHDAELMNCAANWETGYTIRRNANPTQPREYGIGLAIAAPIQNSFLQPRERARRAINIEHCMVARGWRIVRVEQGEGASLAQEPRGQLAALLTPWVGSSEPHGQIVRSWANELSRADFASYKEPTEQDRTSLSELAADPAAPAPDKVVVAKLVPNVPQGKQYKALQSPELASVPAASALVMVRLTGDDSAWGALELERVTTEYDPQRPWGQTMRPQIRGGRFSKKGNLDATFAFAVPPGKWRLTGHRGIDLCMGAPSFEVAAGEVVFLGTFDFRADPFTPVMDLEPARAMLNDKPDLTSRLRPAGWVNGSTSFCRAWYLYAVEFAGFPFEDGYTWGSQASR